MHKILITDDEENIRYFFKRLFESIEEKIYEASSGKETIKLINEVDFDLIILDVKLPDINGLDLLKTIKEHRPDIVIIIVTAYGTTEIAIESIKLGAYDCIFKPFDDDKLEKQISKALAFVDISKSNREVESIGSFDFSKDLIIGRSLKMQEVYKTIGRISTSNTNVLILGESGTGKELIARAIYNFSDRKDKPFLTINCAAIPENLLESELFGYEKGAFTGAHNKKIGKFEKCSEGTIFLDEIGDMPLSIQSKMLRVIQYGSFEPIGSNITKNIDVRIIAATNKDLEKAIKAGQFREDLYYRLNVAAIKLPPLREIKEDIPLLVNYFIQKHSRELRKDIKSISQEALSIIMKYDWPGNIRELENVVKNSIIFSKGEIILPESLSIIKEKEKSEKESNFFSDFNIFDKLIEEKSGDLYHNIISEVEKKLILKVLTYTKGNLSQSAAILGISRPMLRERIQKFDLQIKFSSD